MVMLKCLTTKLIQSSYKSIITELLRFCSVVFEENQKRL
jgi:hypothetical protein